MANLLKIALFIAILMVILRPSSTSQSPFLVAGKVSLRVEPKTASSSIPKIEVEREFQTPKKIIEVKPAPAPEIKQVESTPVIIPEPTPKETTISIISQAELNEKLRSTMVNVICTSKTGGYFHPISGSGVIIDPRGIILTNAHVGQYLLLKDYLTPDFLTCIVRTGSPARPAYTAKLIYLPEKWIQENASQINLSESTGTGENDFALLAIDGTTNSDATLPSSFSYIAPDTMFNLALVNHPILMAGYPAELIGAIATQKDLYLLSSVGNIKDIYHFEDTSENEIDLLSVQGNILSQGGSSGGGVTNLLDGQLIGIIVTSTQAETTGEKILRAITVSYIDRALRRRAGMGLLDFLKGDIVEKIDNFQLLHFDQLAKYLTDALEQ